MPKGTLSLQIQCANCGNAELRFPDQASDGTLITCVNCGRNVGSYGALKAALRSEALTPIGALVTTKVQQVA